MDIIDFVFDSEFYKTSCMGSLPIENGKELDHYRENVLKECLPFNSDLDVDMFNTWVSGDLTNNDEVKILTNALKNFFQKSKYKKLTQTILDHASHSLENWDEMFETFKEILPSTYSSRVLGPVTKVISIQEVEVSNATASYYKGIISEKSTDDSIFRGAVRILAHYSAGNFSEKEFHPGLVEFVQNEYTNQKYNQEIRYIVDKFDTGLLRGKLFDNNIFNQFEDLLDKNRENIHSDNVVEFILHGFESGAYNSVSEGVVDPLTNFFNKFFEFYPDLLLQSSYRILEKDIERVMSSGEILTRLSTVLDREYGLELKEKLSLPYSLASKLVELYMDKSELYLESDYLERISLLAKAIEFNGDIVDEKILKIIEPLQSFLDNIKDLQQGEDEKNAAVRDVVFILGRIHKHHLEIPENILKLLGGMGVSDVNTMVIDSLLMQIQGGDPDSGSKEREGSWDELNLDVSLNKTKEYIENRQSAFSSLGWSTEDFSFISKELSLNPSNSVDSQFKNSVRRIYNYGISKYSVGREGDNILDIFLKEPPQTWSKEIKKIHDYNEFVTIKDLKTLVSETLDLNKDADAALHLVKDLQYRFDGKAEPDSNDGREKAMRDILQLFASIEKESLRYQKQKEIIFLAQNNEPHDTSRSKLYLYGEKDSVYYKVQGKFIPEVKKLDLSELGEKELSLLYSELSVSESIKNHSRQTQGLSALKEAIYKATGYTNKWGEEDFKNWRNNLGDITFEKLPNIVATLNYVMHLTVFKEEYFVRNSQNLAMLLMFASEKRVAQIAPGEGKSEILSMFNVMKSLEGHVVDLASSSAALIAKDVEKQESFYKKLGFSSGAVTKGNSILKECYKKDVLYGDPLSFIGDELGDMLTPVRHGRNHDVLNIDEVDFLAIDEFEKKVQLQSGIPGFSSLEQIRIYLWGAFQYSSKSVSWCNETNRLFIWAPSEENGTLNYSKVYINGSYREIVGAQLESFLDDTGVYNTSLDRIKKPVVVYKHLEEFVSKHCKNWINSLFTSTAYNKDVEYSTQDDNQYENRTTISTVDSDTGIINRNLQLSDGLHQFIQYNEGLPANDGSIASTYMSYISFFPSYASIFGVTGTLGGATDKAFLKEMFNVDFVEIPQYIHKRLTKFPEILSNNYEEWLGDVIESIKDITGLENGDGRAVLVINKSIKGMHLIAGLLRASGHQGRVMEYGHKDTLTLQESGIGVLEPGDVVVSTNIAGRGTDLQIHRLVEENGGLHVITTFMPNNERIEAQNMGRAARKDERGSAQFIINLEEDSQDLESCNSDDLISCLKKARDEKFDDFMKEARFCKVTETKVRDDLFRKYISLVRRTDSPIGADIVLAYSEEPQANQENTIYLYLKDDHVKIQSWNKENKDRYILDITDYIRMLDEGELDNIKRILSYNSTPKGLPYQSYEIINFISAYNGHMWESTTMERVVLAYEKSFKIPSFFSEKNFVQMEEEFLRDLYLSQEDKKYYEIKQIDKARYLDEAHISKEDLESTKLNKLYGLWLESRKIYSKKYENEQMQELFACWLRVSVSTELKGCDISKTEEELILLEKTTRENAIAEVEKFAEIMAQRIQNVSLIENPIYLLKKAYQMESIAGNQRKNGIVVNSQEKRDLEYPFSTHEKDPAYDEKISESSYMSMAFSMISSAVYSLSSFFGQEGMRSVNATLDTSKVYIENPEEEAQKLTREARVLEDVIVWTSENAISVVKLFDDQRKYTKQNQGREVSESINHYIDHTIKARSNLENEIIPRQESELVFLLSQNLVDRESPLIQAKASQISAYKAVSESMSNNIEIAQNASASGDKMIRVVRHIEAVDLVQIHNEGLNATNITNSTNSSEETPFARAQESSIDDLLKRSFSEGEFEPIHDQITQDGGLLFEIKAVDLKQESWWSTFFVAALGVGSIILGFVIAGPLAGVFTNMIASSFIAMGVGDLISSAMSLISDTPIALGQYMKGKVAEFAVAMITSAAGAALGFAASTAAETMLESALGVNLASSAFSYIGGKYYSKNDGDMEAEIREGLSNLFNKLRYELKVLYASDKYASTSFASELRQEAIKIMSNYAEKGQGTGSKILKGSASSMASRFVTNSFAASTTVGIAAGFAGSIIGLGEGISKLDNMVENFVNSASDSIKNLKVKASEQRHFDADQKASEISDDDVDFKQWWDNQVSTTFFGVLDGSQEGTVKNSIISNLFSILNSGLDGWIEGNKISAKKEAIVKVANSLSPGEVAQILADKHKRPIRLKESGSSVFIKDGELYIPDAESPYKLAPEIVVVHDAASGQYHVVDKDGFSLSFNNLYTALAVVVPGHSAFDLQSIAEKEISENPMKYAMNSIKRANNGEYVVTGPEQGGFTPFPDGFFPEDGGMTPIPDGFFPAHPAPANDNNMEPSPSTSTGVFDSLIRSWIKDSLEVSSNNPHREPQLLNFWGYVYSTLLVSAKNEFVEKFPGASSNIEKGFEKYDSIISGIGGYAGEKLEDISDIIVGEEGTKEAKEYIIETLKPIAEHIDKYKKTLSPVQQETFSMFFRTLDVIGLGEAGVIAKTVSVNAGKVFVKQGVKVVANAKIILSQADEIAASFVRSAEDLFTPNPHFKPSFAYAGSGGKLPGKGICYLDDVTDTGGMNKLFRKVDDGGTKVGAGKVGSGFDDIAKPHMEKVGHESGSAFTDNKVYTTNLKKASDYADNIVSKLDDGSKAALGNLGEAERNSLHVALKGQALEKGGIMAGPNVKNKFRDAEIFSKQHGGVPDDYVKVHSNSYKVRDTVKVETHWVENIKTGNRYDVKIKVIEVKSGRE
jgi:hypothetical protein